MTAQGIVMQPGKGTVQSFTPGRAIVTKLRCADTADSMMVFEETVPTGTKSTFHLHHDSDEIAYVLEGEVTFLIRARRHAAAPRLGAARPLPALNELSSPRS